jgi:hypothetical protein
LFQRQEHGHAYATTNEVVGTSFAKSEENVKNCSEGLPN